MTSFDNDMEIDYEEYYAEQKRRRELRRKRREAERRRHLRIVYATGAGILLVLLLLVILLIRSCGEDISQETEASVPLSEELVVQSIEPESVEQSEEPEPVPVVYTEFSEAQVLGAIPQNVVSDHVLVADVGEGRIIAGKELYTRMNPASMTKVLTILTAMDYVKNLDDRVEITQDITDYTFKNDCSAVGYPLGTMPTVRELFYGTILPSGADAAIALAKYCCGSWQDFVDKMNEKLDDMGLTSSHMTNVVGIYNRDHYSTLYDIAVIMTEAMKDPFLAEVLGKRKMNTEPCEEHPEGIEISNWFLRRIEDKDCHGEVIGAKTGFVNQSGNCAVSYGVNSEGKTLVIVTGGSTSSWRCIYDHVELYQMYL